MPEPRLPTSVCLVLIALAGAVPAQGGALFERVADTLEARYYDKAFRRDKLPALARQFRAAAQATGTLEEERIVVHAFLARIPASHLALYSKATADHVLGELSGKPDMTYGFQVIEQRGRFYTAGVLEAGPAAKAGLRPRERIVALDGKHPAKSRLLAWRSDDAHLDDLPRHEVFVRDGKTVRVRVRRDDGPHDVVVRAARWSGAQASQASIRVIERGGKHYGYVHLWFIFFGSSRLVRDALRGPFKDCDGVILDLRGRGGVANEVQPLVSYLARHKKRGGCPVVAVIDRESRSAKEVIAFELKRKGYVTLVGEHTAGAVIPATFENVGHDSVLMFPSFTLGRFTRDIELIGVMPDVPAADLLPRRASDPLVEAGLRELARRAADQSRRE